VQRIGYDVQAHFSTGSSDSTTVRLTRGQAETLGMAEGSQVWLRVAATASTLRTSAVDAHSAVTPSYGKSSVPALR